MAALLFVLAILGASVVAELVVENTGPDAIAAVGTRSPATARACCWPWRPPSDC
jgi:hypothetical protein